jgi:hypothetical protein
MTIRIYNNKVMIGSYTLQEGPGGLVFDGYIRAEKFVREGTFQGTVAGFAAGGWGGPSTPHVNVIDKFSFAFDQNATDHGDLTIGRYGFSGLSSDVHGYSAGGYDTGAVVSNTIDKFAFATNSNAIDVGDLTQVVYNNGGNSSKLIAQGFSSGSALPSSSNIIERIPFVTDTNSFDVGDLTVARGLQASQTSNTHAYNSGGEPSNASPGTNVVDKFPFASTGYILATDVGDLTLSRGRTCGQSSLTHGYTSGGATTWPPGGPFSAVIDKFPFASDSNATSVGNLSDGRAIGAGASSVVSGYTAGGSPTFAVVTTIDKFPFATDASAASVGALTAARSHCAGFQI